MNNGKKSCKYYTACGNGDNCVRCNGYERSKMDERKMNNKNYFDERGNYINIENLSLADIYHRAFALGVESTAITTDAGQK